MDGRSVLVIKGFFVVLVIKSVYSGISCVEMVGCFLFISIFGLFFWICEIYFFCFFFFIGLGMSRDGIFVCYSDVVCWVFGII